MKTTTALLPAATAALLVLTPTLQAQNQAVVLTNGSVDAHFDVGPDPRLVPPGGITIEAWIQYDDTTMQTGSFRWPTVARHNVQPGQENYLLRVGASNSNNTSFEWGVRTANSGFQRLAWQFAPGQLLNWTHIAATYDGQQLALYADGVLQQSLPTPNAGRIVDTGGVLRIGNGDVSSPGAEVWNGLIDEVRIWPYAKTQDEILATKDLEAALVPGDVMTFNLNGIFLDTSLLLMGQPTGPIAFQSSTLALPPTASGAVAAGAPSTTCPEIPRATVGSFPSVGNASFTVVGTNGPASSNAVVLTSLTALQAPVRIVAIDVWVDLLGPSVGTGVPTDALGASHLSLPIPNTPSLVGASLAFQAVHLHPGCAPRGGPGLTASDAVTATVF